MRKKPWGESSPREKGDGVRVHHEKKAMGREFTKRKRDGVRVQQKKERWGGTSP